MAYGKIKADTLTWDDAGTDTDITISTIPTAADLAAKLGTADIGVTVQGYDADTAKYDDVTANFTGTLQNGGSDVVVDSDIGVSVQAYDADTAKLDVAQTFTAEQTFGEIVEGSVSYAAVTGTVALDPANGSLQRFSLAANTTFTDSLVNGQSIVVQIENNGFTVTWPSITWVTSSGNVLPTTLTAKDTFVIWKNTSFLYIAYVGSYV